MLPSSTLDASICLRCHLRLSVRQIGSRSRPLFQQRRHQSSESFPDGPVKNEEEQEPVRARPLIRRTNDSGRPRRNNNREPRYRETTAKLPISSLNHETEVIVLRDLPKRRKKSQPRAEDAKVEEVDDGPNAEPSLPSLTAKDIQSFANKNNQKLAQEEVNVSIDSSRFGDQEVITSAQYEAKLKELVDSYNVNQLRRYSQREVFRSRLHLTTPKVVRPSTPEGVAPVSSIKKDLSVTPWTPVQTRKITPGHKAPPATKAAYSKRLVADRILRKCWAIQVEDELSRAGKINIYLLPEQYHLWTNSTSEAVKSVQPSSQFYQNSQLSVYPAECTIQITGPQAEAESMAATIRDAFKTSHHSTVHLEKLEELLKDGQTFHDIFPSWQLERIMSLTNSWVAHDTGRNMIKLSSFDKASLRDASRLVISLLPVPNRTSVPDLPLEQDLSGCFLLPIANNKSLSYRHRFGQAGRLVQPVTRPETIDEEGTDNPSEIINRSATESGQEDISEKVLQLISSASDRTLYGEPKSDSYWASGATFSRWKARFGQVLHPLSGPSPISFDAPATTHATHGLDKHFTAQNHLSEQTFAPTFPTNLGVLSQVGILANTFEHIKRSPPLRPPVQLVARLIPSPVTSLGLYASRLFPEISIKFQEETITNGNDVYRPLFEKTVFQRELRFSGMEATLEHQVVDVPLPHQPLDLRLDRRLLLKSRNVMQDKRISSYVASILESEKSKEGAIRAPPTLMVKIPYWAIKPLRGACYGVKDKTESLLATQNTLLEQCRSSKTKDVEVNYSFAGFEYRERRNINPAQESLDKDIYFSPNHVLSVEHIEGGLMFSKRMQASIMAKRPQHSPSTKTESVAGVPLPAISGNSSTPSQGNIVPTEEELLRTAFSMIDLIGKLQRRELQAKMKKSSRSTAFRQYERQRGATSSGPGSRVLRANNRRDQHESIDAEMGVGEERQREEERMVEGYEKS